MGSLKEEMRSFRGDHKTSEMAGDGDCAGGSDVSAAPEGPQLSAGQESTHQGDDKLGLGTCANSLMSEDLSPGDHPDPTVAQDPGQTVCIPLIHQPEAEQTQNHKATLSNVEVTIPVGMSEEQTADAVKEISEANENIPVPATPGPYEAWSPAPDGQHHMRTQVSLEVVQCRSAATSPMTPAQGGSSFFFPSTVGRSVESGDTRDAEMQVGALVELCSVATSPMTPKTPFSTAFPELIGKEGGRGRREQQNLGSKQDGTAATETSESEMSGDSAQVPSRHLHFDPSVSTGGSAGRPHTAAAAPAAAAPAAATSMEPQVMLRDGSQQCQQQRMGSLDQDITITVTHYNNKKEEGVEEEEEEEEGGSPCFHIEQDTVKIDEYEEPEGEVGATVPVSEGEEKASPEEQGTRQSPPGEGPQARTTGTTGTAGEPLDEPAAPEGRWAGRAAVPESPAPFGCHNIRTQVSLEVVQCQSVATSPMTPPEGDQAFHFPSSLAKSLATAPDSRDAESQAGRSAVECRSVATAPMTPRTPTLTTFPEVGRGPGSTGGAIAEEDEDKKEKQDEAEEAGRAGGGQEKCEEPVQEVSWDEEGMTWEVYGAVVEVTVLGSAIQKHLEKQVKKRQPSMPPPPPLNLSAVPPTAGQPGGSGRGGAGKRRERAGEAGRRRRNPFRQMMENMQQPHCCSKAHTTE